MSNPTVNGQPLIADATIKPVIEQLAAAGREARAAGNEERYQQIKALAIELNTYAHGLVRVTSELLALVSESEPEPAPAPVTGETTRLFNKEIVPAKTGRRMEYACFLDGQYIGTEPTNHDAEERLNCAAADLAKL